MDDSRRSMKEGDICFAHVRSFPWWPAQIKNKTVKNIKKGQIVYSVLFFGTDETANLPQKELLPVSSETIEKYVTKSSMKRKFFKEAYDELLERRELLENEVEVEVKEKFPDKHMQQEFLSVLGLLPQCAEPTPSDQVEDQPMYQANIKSSIGSSDLHDDEVAEFADFFAEFKSHKKFTSPSSLWSNLDCIECSESFHSEPALYIHSIMEHGQKDDDDSDMNDDESTVDDRSGADYTCKDSNDQSLDERGTVDDDREVEQSRASDDEDELGAVEDDSEEVEQIRASDDNFDICSLGLDIETLKCSVLVPNIWGARVTKKC